ncbi:hypothetical protein SAMN05216251_13617 [Actinacidiphila alni]|uniref:Uncharacterized protein n=1 Tax=Actinacidiphila alni TaxID=380248 RepID=A0A1I2MNG5_9ACTN|nr:hypothetical protein [Actinacidiphila alni]SFF90916.1 hypothetical protein SAMN05216251_13617 [Actinacidiphila alni]
MDESLSFESLFEGSKKAAHRAMEDHGHGEYDWFALHAGVSIERLAKATLYKMNPLYIAGGKVQIVTGQKKFTVHTISMSEALARLAQLGIGKVTPSLRLLIDLRNGTVHTSSGDEAKSHIPTFAKAISAMLRHLGISEDDFWGRLTSTVNLAVDEQRSEVERDVQLRIKQAQHRLDDRLAGLPLPDEIRSPNLAGFTFAFGTGSPDGDGEVVSVSGDPGCPACGRQAQVMVERSAAAGGPVAVALICPWCNLRLNSPEEIGASGVDMSISLEVADDVLHGDYE